MVAIAQRRAYSWSLQLMSNPGATPEHGRGESSIAHVLDCCFGSRPPARACEDPAVLLERKQRWGSDGWVGLGAGDGPARTCSSARTHAKLAGPSPAPSEAGTTATDERAQRGAVAPR